YYDAESVAYRERFFHDPLFAGLDLDGKDVADLACGSGVTSLAIRRRFPGARTFGFDLSEQACADYEVKVGRPAFVADLTRTVDVGRTFDAAIVIGGLHHCVADLPRTFANIRSLLRPGGLLLMMEPSDDFLLAGLRRLWYRVDHYFEAETERALSHDDILATAGPGWSLVDVRHLGGPAYFLILNSLVFRVPRAMKRALAPPLGAIEAVYNRLPGKLPFACFVARWRRD
ncbi:MAG TPA: class I SAM-dependent methyltransferase, partial [Thermoanaerobaculia bacterium]|nr:class I SAM-dependent methyltransferase [Thermoanaerobaculia bacterium]